MKKACLYVDDFYLNNRIFDLSDPVANRDNCLLPYVLLRDELKKRGVDLATQDINLLQESEIAIFNDIPKSFGLLKLRNKLAKKNYALLFETELIKKRNWNLIYHKAFEKIFTWNDDFVEREPTRYVKMNFSNDIKTDISNYSSWKDFDHREIFCTLIAGNKKCNHPLELYSKRLEAINWFENNKKSKFKYFGAGWDIKSFCCNTFVGKILNRLRLGTTLSSTCCGKIKNKGEVLNNCKFSICFENARDIPGYITEKIFDSLSYGCIPVYWGALNIDKYIPKNCFIDMRDFDSHESLVKYLESIDEDKFNQYHLAIKSFFGSNQAKQFSHPHFVETIIATMALL